MPTLMPCALKEAYVPPANTSSSHAPASITLSFQGIDFCLEPADAKGELSYKHRAADGGILVSLNAFTGTLLISQSGGVGVSVRPSNASTDVTDLARTVEEEPDSPGVVSGKGSQKVSPGQQKIAFDGKAKSGNKKTDSRKRTNDDSVKTPKASSKTTKRSRVTEEKPKQKEVKRPVLLCQQPSQEETPLPLQQTLDSGNSVATASETESEHVVTTTTTTSGILKNDSPKDTVKDILDRVNSTASVKHDEDDEVATRIEGEYDDNNAMDFDLTTGSDEKHDPAKSTTIIDVTVTDTEFKGYGPPSPRWGATMTEVQDGKFLVYGGQSYDVDGNTIIMSDVYTYDPKTRTWDKPVNSRGEKRQWHSAVYIENRNQIIAFGGETIDTVSTGKNKIVLSDTLRVLDTDIMLWYPPAATGDIPTGRSGHSCVFFEQTNEMVVFGGVRGSKWLNAVSVLDITSWVWTTPKIDGSPPKPRSFHSATAVGNKMVVFGGNGKTSCFNTVHVLEAMGNNQGDVSSSDSYGWKWSHPTVKGNAPFPRTGHSATLLEDGKTILIYGGWDPNEEDEESGGENIFKSSYFLDTQDWTWKEGPKPTSIGSGTDSHTIQDCGPKRCGHRAIMNAEKGEVLVFGGRIPGEALANDMQRFDLSNSD